MINIFRPLINHVNVSSIFKYRYSWYAHPSNLIKPCLAIIITHERTWDVVCIIAIISRHGRDNVILTCVTTELFLAIMAILLDDVFPVPKFLMFIRSEENQHFSTHIYLTRVAISTCKIFYCSELIIILHISSTYNLSQILKVEFYSFTGDNFQWLLNFKSYNSNRMLKYPTAMSAIILSAIKINKKLTSTRTLEIRVVNSSRGSFFVPWSFIPVDWTSGRIAAWPTVIRSLPRSLIIREGRLESDGIVIFRRFKINVAPISGTERNHALGPLSFFSLSPFKYTHEGMYAKETIFFRSLG